MMKRSHLLFTAGMWILGLLMIYPFVSMVVISLRPSGLVYKSIWYPVTPTLINYKKVVTHPNFLNWCINTLYVVIISIVLRLFVTLPAAYAFARLRFRFSGVLLALLMASLMVPSETTMVSRYFYYKTLHLFDTPWVIILPELSEVFYLLLMIQFFRLIPRELNEAASIDGSGHWRALVQIFIPLSTPAIATMVLFSFINIWNNFLDPYLFISSIERQLLTPALKFFQEHGGANIPVQLAGSAIAIIPIIILFVSTQKYFVEGISASGLKG